MKKGAAVLIALILVLGALSTAHAISYTFTSLDYPDAISTSAYGINKAGTIVGTYEDASGYHGFTLRGGSFTSIDYPGANHTEALGINDAGTIVGWYFSYPNDYHGFTLSGGIYTTLDYPGAWATIASGINDAGTIVGQTNLEFGFSFFLNGTTYTPFDYPGDVLATYAFGINDAGTIVGTYRENLAPHGFSLSNGTFSSIDYSDTGHTWVFGINDAGTIVGTYEDVSGNHGFTRSGGIYTTVDYPGATYTEASGINDAGTIVGTYEDVSGVHGFVAIPAPEPITIDVRPGSKRNQINYRGRGVLPVAILSAEGFDAPDQVDRKSLTFGATGNERSLAFCNPRPRDLSREGLRDDLVCYFYVQTAGFGCGDTVGTLEGKTISGMPIEGKDTVRIINCR